MKKVIVIPAGGARLTGPVRVKLTRAQYEPRAHMLGPRKKNGIIDLDGGQVITLKQGEVVEVMDLSKLNKAQFEEVGDGPATAPEPGTGKGAVQPGDDSVTAAEGSDSVSGAEGGVSVTAAEGGASAREGGAE